MNDILIENLKMDNRSLIPQAVPHGDFYTGDVLELLPALVHDYAKTVKLVYLDPPFMTGREFSAVLPVGNRGYKGDRKYFCEVPLYSDCWENKDEYLAFIRRVTEGAKELMCDDGVICMHVDKRAVASVRLLLDELFGEKCFINEIIWHYHSGGTTRYAFAAKHDNLLIYGKTPKVKLNPAAVGKKRTSEKHNHMKRNVDPDGRIYFSINSNGKEYRYYEDEVVMDDDVWDIPHLQQKHPERTGYGTQKPLELLDKIVGSCSNEGELVCDLFAGSGTSLLSAHNHNRRYLGVDLSPLSLQTFRRRLAVKEALDLTIHYAVPVNDLANISLHKDELQGLVKVRLNGYSMVDKGVAVPRYEDGRQYITYWALGRMEGNTFITDDFSVRSNENPELKDNLSAPEGGEKAVYFCDCIGNQRFIRI